MAMPQCVLKQTYISLGFSLYEDVGSVIKVSLGTDLKSLAYFVRRKLFADQGKYTQFPVA